MLKLDMSKYLGPASAKCLYCRKGIQPLQIISNQYHLYEIGVLYQCPCQKTQIWTNSIRGGKAAHLELIKKLLGQEHQFIAGFCNDLFCGFNLQHSITCLKTGYPWSSISNTDVFGCQNCRNYFGFWLDRREPERNPPILLNFYRENLDQLQDLIEQIFPD